ncbi:DUF262 domain-containing protein [Flavobacterium psychrophilum]|uniref:DUF262 domain-containing protein n=1 Tax=Flavobacterium psychrophilum TaxID=96345 RepID=UPI000B7C2F2F|nr:DUF262 domain-containing protein [Flavobacterium psychrophilum]EKT4502307.1 DUF262 domain-containing protein [Flavobacterium psychrophilum]MBF2024122.1 DUF262 domain-containing protein [Flavobacterium psychrophilum]MCB5984055.1 DUF262 domain-containing protein [Flavobacterium psychrophilum]MCB5995462.1 DUF262 domain-containing protein [Flavobacterium psychrophilum]MCB5997868.1 DUF262 domain-containing protein [Flavobacterium psychrophilum]
MKPGKYTIKELFVNREVEQIVIPEIQRDYVWKKEQVEGLMNSLLSDYIKFDTEIINVTADNEEIKNLFINYYKKQQYASNIGFIYAYNDAEYKGKYFLIDGQQRVTTVYLLLLNLFIGTDQKADFEKKYFKDSQLKIDFKVRESSRDFFKNFIRFCLDNSFEETVDFRADFINKLTTQYWYYNEYANDKTIQSIINNYVAINSFVQTKSLNSKNFLNYILDYVDCWYFDTNISEQGEELYIYMNARGEQIQNNENIKADLLGALKETDIELVSEREDYNGEKSVDGLKKYWGKKWEDWQDFFWVNKGTNDNADNGFNEFLKCIAGLEQYLVKIERQHQEFSSIYDLITLPKLESYIDNFKWLINNKVNFTQKYSYSTWSNKCIERIWELFNNDTTDWFIDYSDDNKALELNRMAFIWPIFYYQNQKGDNQNIDEAYRVLRIFYIRLNNNIRAVKSVKGLVEYIVRNGVWDNNKLQLQNLNPNQKLDDEEEAKNVKTYLKEEIEKHAFLVNQTSDEIRQIEELIWEIEDHPINLNGRNLKNQNSSHLVDFNDGLNLEELKLVKNKFYELFPFDDIEKEGYKFSKNLQPLLLHYGKFHHKVKPNYLDNYDFNNWRRIVRNADGEAFKNFFETFKKSTAKLRELLDIKEKEFCNNNNDILKKVQDLYSQLIIYSIILKQEAWKKGGRMAIKNWESQDGLFDNTANIYNLQSNFISQNEKLWTLVPKNSKDKITETSTVSELYNNILKDE